MKFRTRLLLAFAAVVVVPLVALILGIRSEVGERLDAQYRDRLDRLARLIDADLEGEGVALGRSLDAIADAISSDNRFRLALSGQGDRRYILDYAPRVMEQSGLAMLWIHDSAGRILSSGHFRNEFDRVVRPPVTGPDPVGVGVQKALFLTVRAPDGEILALARRRSIQLGGDRLLLTAGVDAASRVARYTSPDSAVSVRLALAPDAALERPDALATRLAEPAENATADSTLRVAAALVVSQALGPLAQVRRNVDLWFVLAGLIALAGGLVMAVLLSNRVSEPLEALADKADLLDLERLDVRFDVEAEGEVGSLARTLQRMAERLQASSATLREAERRATVGDLARQLNHDIKNGLMPVRNVFRHLAQVAREQPAQLPAIFQERQATIEAGITYLENLARNYARLTPALDRQPSDLNAIINEVVPPLGTGAELKLDLAPDLPQVAADPLVLRRILENLVSNAVESLDEGGGMVTVITRAAGNGSATPSVVRLTVADQGRGMTEQQLERAFQDFYTTKAGGTGLGLSIIRRLVLDLNGSLRVETAPSAGTRFIVELPTIRPSDHPTIHQ